MGFVWNEKKPEFVAMEVGTSGVTNIDSFSLNIDGEILDLEPLPDGTDFGIFNTHSFEFFMGSIPVQVSTRKFIVGMNQFREMANANDVRIRIGLQHRNFVFKFGKNYPDETINDRFIPFLKKVDVVKSKK